MFETVLVAHRGPLALRVVRTLQRLGVQAVTVHSGLDATARHVTQADESVLLGPAEPAASYLDGARVLEAARRTGAQAVHPGCGALAEDPAFARAVVTAGLVWIGPDPAVVGRGRGPRGSVGVQLLGAGGQVLAVGEHLVRAGGPDALDATTDRDEALREAAVRAAADVEGLATVELDPGSAGPEVRRLTPRLQAGHTVTEVAYDVDLVELQLLAAAGAPVTWRPGAARGVALAARVYAGAPGRLTAWAEPVGVRVDSGFVAGDTVPPLYDPLLAVVTVLGRDRAEAGLLLHEALGGFTVGGVPTNLPRLLERPHP